MKPIRPTGPRRTDNDAFRRTKPSRPTQPQAQAFAQPIRVPHASDGRKFGFVGNPPLRPAQGRTSGPPVTPPTEQAALRHLGKVRPGARRKRNVKLRNIKVMALSAVVAVTLILGAAFCLTDSAFNITSVQIQGIPAADQATIQSMSEDASLGNNVFTFWLFKRHSLASHIKDSDPEIDRVSIRPSLPSGLNVVVLERTPDLLVSYGRDASLGAWMIDRDGIPIRNSASLRWNDRPQDMLKVYIDARRADPVALSAVRLGEPLPAVMQSTVRDLLTLKETLTASPLWPDIGSVRIDNSGYLGLNMRSHLLIKLGDISSLDKKVALASALVSQRSDIVGMDRYIDLTDPDWPAVMPRSHSAEQVGSTSIAPALPMTNPLSTESSVPR